MTGLVDSSCLLIIGGFSLRLEGVEDGGGVTDNPYKSRDIEGMRFSSE